jgi:hypothetical protein
MALDQLYITEASYSDEVPYRRYDLGTKDSTTLKLPDAWWPSDWSADGTRLLTGMARGIL